MREEKKLSAEEIIDISTTFFLVGMLVAWLTHLFTGQVFIRKIVSKLDLK